MRVDILKRAAWFLVYVFLQTIVFGRIHLYGVATPLLYVYFMLQFPRNYPKWANLLWGFFLGLAVDIFANTPGLAAASLTLLAAVQPYYLELFVPREAAENLQPSMAVLGVTRYIYYALPLVLLFVLIFYSLEFFNFIDWQHWLACVGSSTLLTMAIILTLEVVKSR